LSARFRASVGRAKFSMYLEAGVGVGGIELMVRRLQLKGWIGIGVATLSALPPLGAQEVKVSAAVCGSRVHVIATKAPLSEVLRRLSNELGFELRFEGNSDPMLDIDIAQEPRDLVAKLAPSISLIIRQERDPRCPGQQRIAAVWVVAQGRDTLPQASVSPLPAPKEVPMTREAQEALER
jgi:hypothetical protein